MMKKTFTKLFVAFLALLLAPSGVWAQDALTVNGTAVDVSADVADVLDDGKVSYTASTKTLTLADGATLTGIVNNSVDDLEIYIAQSSTVNLQSLTCNAPVTVYGGGTLNVSSTSGSTVSIGEEGSLTIGKNGQEAPMNVNLTSTDNEGCCIHFNDNIATVAFTVIGSNVTLTGIPTNANGFDGEDEDAVAAYVDCTLDLNADPITITANGGSAESDAVGDVFYTETEIGDGTLRIPYTVLALANGETPGTVAFGLDGEDYTNDAASYTGEGQIDFTIPASVTSPNGSTYNVTEGYSINTPLAFEVEEGISFIKTLTIPATLKRFNDNFLSGITPKNDNEKLETPVSGLEKVIFANGSVQADIVFTGESGCPFATLTLFDESYNVIPSVIELVIPNNWDNVLNNWGKGDWTGDKVITPVHYQIWINNNGSEDGIEVTSLNKDDVLEDGEGTVTYNPATKELTIKSTNNIHHISNGETYYKDLRPGVDGLKIIIPEDETVNMSMVDEDGEDPVLSINNNTIITGGGTLNIEHRINPCINIGDYMTMPEETIPGHLTIKDVTVNVRAIGYHGYGINIVNRESSLTINHAMVTLENQDGGDNYFSAEDVVMRGYAGNEPTLINCQITTDPAPTWAVLTGEYWNSGVTDEENMAYGYQVSALTIAPKADLVAEVEDDSYDDVTIGLTLAPGKTDEVVVTVETGETATGTVVIPQTVTASDNAEYTVTGIAANAFQGQTNIKSVSLPKTVTSIGAGAFAGCTNMTSLKVQSPFVPEVNNAFDATANLTVNYPAAAYTNYNDASWTGVATFQPTVMQPNEWSTICSTQDFTLPEGIEAYIVVGIDYTSNKVLVKKVDGIKANVPLMIHKTGTDEDYPVTVGNIAISEEGTQLPTTAGDADAFVGYAPLSDEVAPMAIPTGTSGTPYILINGTFVKWTEGNLAPYRCFLWATQAFNTGNAPQMGIEIVDGETTGVGDVRGKKDDVRGEWYDLSGRKLQGKPTQKGVYIINGKKVNVK